MRILRGRSFHTVTGKGYSPGVVKLGRLKWVTFGFCILVFFLWVVLPIGQLLVGSFFRFVGFYRMNMLTLEHYRAVFTNRDFWEALTNTILLGFMGATATMILGGVVAYVTTRTHWRGRKLIETIAWLPWMMPGMVLGIGLLWAYAMLPLWIPIYGTIWALFLAYVTLATPLSVRIMSGAYAQLSMDLEECSRVMGANWWQTLWRILIALSWPSFVVGWILVFFSIMRELSASILLYSADSKVLSVEMLRMWTNGKIEQLTVVSLIVLLLVLLFRWVQLKFVQKQVSAL
jgi:iron(III) transport system permease protein